MPAEFITFIGVFGSCYASLHILPDVLAYVFCENARTLPPFSRVVFALNVTNLIAYFCFLR